MASMKSTSAFVADIFDLFDAQERFNVNVKDSDSIFHNTAALIHNLVFRQCFHVIFGVFPTKLHYQSFVSSQDKGIPTLMTVHAWVRKTYPTHALVNFAAPQIEAMQGQINQLAETLRVNPTVVRMHVASKLWDRYVSAYVPDDVKAWFQHEPSMQKIYEDIILKHSHTSSLVDHKCVSVKDMFGLADHLITKHDMLEKNPMNGTVNGREIACNWKRLLLPEEATRYSILSDPQLTHDLADAVLVQLADQVIDVDVPMLRTIMEAADEVNNQKPVVFVGDHDAFKHVPETLNVLHLRVPRLFGYVTQYLPRLCNSHVYWAGGGGTQPFPVPKSSSPLRNVLYCPNLSKCSHVQLACIASFGKILTTGPSVPGMLVYDLPKRSFNNKNKALETLMLSLVPCFWKHHLKFPCPLLASRAGAGEPVSRACGVLPYLQFLLRYVQAHERDINKRMQDPMKGKKNKNCIVIIENRPNVLTAMACIVTALNLDADSWEVVLVCTPSAMSFFKSVIPANWIGNVHELSWNDLPDKKFNVRKYSDLLKNADFWRTLEKEGYENCLIIQDDGLLARPGAEVYAEKWAYTGAPWSMDVSNSFMRGIVNDQFVGNGGISMRNCKKMADTCATHAKEAKQLFAHLPQELPEDVFFAKYIDKSQICPREHAAKFAVEQVMRMDALGFHKPWPYHGTESLMQFFEGLLEGKKSLFGA